MTRVLHTGDTHLGYQQYHVPQRRKDFLDAFRQVVDDAIADDVDAVVHAGDLFHDRRPTLPDILGTLEVLERLDEHDVPFLAIVGNHEAKRDAQWLDLFESLGLATRLGFEPTVAADTAFYGLDFVPRSRREDLTYDFAPNDADHTALVAHGLFEPFDLGEWDPTEILDGSPVDFDALLLGDNHIPDTAQVQDTWITYCGSTERTSADERDERGYNLVTFDDEVTIARRGLDTREFVFVELELAAEEGVERVRQRVGEHDLEDAVVIVHIDGDGDPIAPAQIEEYALESGALVARVTDHREGAGDGEIEVSFADPDDAVRERVRELGLSEAARDLDETIRASKVADSNVADTVQRRVRELIDEDPTAFDRVPEPAADDAATTPQDTDDGDEVPAASEPDGASETTDEEATAEVTDGDHPTNDAPADDNNDDDDTAVGETEAGDTAVGETTDDGTADDGTVEATTSDDAAQEETGEADGQATMESFLGGGDE